MNIAIVYILISVIGGAIGQVLLKMGMNKMGPLTISFSNLFNLLWQIATNWLVVLGLVIYMFSVVFWLVALSRVDLSYAYPFASVSYILMLIASWLILHETITPIRLVGSIVVVVGVYLISRS